MSIYFHVFIILILSIYHPINFIIRDVIFRYSTIRYHRSALGGIINIHILCGLDYDGFMSDSRICPAHVLMLVLAYLLPVGKLVQLDSSLCTGHSDVLGHIINISDANKCSQQELPNLRDYGKEIEMQYVCHFAACMYTRLFFRQHI